MREAAGIGSGDDHDRHETSKVKDWVGLMDGALEKEQRMHGNAQRMQEQGSARCRIGRETGSERHTHTQRQCAP